MTHHRNQWADAQHIKRMSEPAPSVLRRQTCDRCHERLSIGQFPRDSQVCIGCVPQGANFRRGFV